MNQFTHSRSGEPEQDSTHSQGNTVDGCTICSKMNRILRSESRRTWLAWGFSALGLVSLLWFLVRVIPKPSRAAYPCQRAAFPVASSFVVWLAALLGSSFAWRKFLRRDARVWQVCFWCAAALALAALVVTSLPTVRAWAADNSPHPKGAAKGIFPGRVVWVHAPEATSWDGYEAPEHWFETNHTDLAVVEEMMSKAIRSVGGRDSDAESWDAIFRYFNTNHSRGDRGYLAGEKIAIKINLTTCNARTNYVDIHGTYEKTNASLSNPSDTHWLNTVDNSPQMLLSLLRQLVCEVRVEQTNIYLGDPTANFPRYLWTALTNEFPGVHYFDNFGGQGRMRTELDTNVPVYWSGTNGIGRLQDYVPVPVAVADYLINFALLKGHSTGITVCGKNWYGALLRCPDRMYRDAFGSNQWGKTNFADLHKSTPLASPSGTPGLKKYRAIVDLMGHPALGGKTLLCMVDGLFGGYFANSHPYKWNMPPFNGDWPSSLFVSQDPVAIDSVCYDFLLNEWPNVVKNGSESPGNALQGGAEDYLHEAAGTNDSASGPLKPESGIFYDPAGTGAGLKSLGVHEHWNDATNKQYGRNLGKSTGIELVSLPAPDPLSVRKAGSQAVISWQGSLTDFRLQSVALLTATNLWSDVSNSPVRVHGRNIVTNDISGAHQFYRLIK